MAMVRAALLVSCLASLPGPAYSAPLASRAADVVAEVLRAEAPYGPWSAEDGYCLDLSAKWLERLRRAGLPARLVTVDPALAPGGAVADGRRVRAGKFHAVVLVGEEGPEELLLDPSYRQFFTEPSGLPEVFLGSRGQAAKLFAARRTALRVELYDDPYLGRYEPVSFAELVYGYGPNAPLRQVHP